MPFCRLLLGFGLPSWDRWHSSHLRAEVPPYQVNFASVWCTGGCAAGTSAWHLAPPLWHWKVSKHGSDSAVHQESAAPSAVSQGLQQLRWWFSQVSAPHSASQRHTTDSWNPTGSQDLSPYIVARHLGKPLPRSSCTSVMLLIILSQAWSVCLEVRNAFHLWS